MGLKIHFAKTLPDNAPPGLRPDVALCGRNVKRNKQPSKIYRPGYVMSTGIPSEVDCEGCLKNGRFPK